MNLMLATSRDTSTGTRAPIPVSKGRGLQLVDAKCRTSLRIFVCEWERATSACGKRNRTMFINTKSCFCQLRSSTSICLWHTTKDMQSSRMAERKNETSSSDVGKVNTALTNERAGRRKRNRRSLGDSSCRKTFRSIKHFPKHLKIRIPERELALTSARCSIPHTKRLVGRA